jgi:hypothetical protein
VVPSFDTLVTPAIAKNILALPVVAGPGAASLVSMYRSMMPETRHSFHTAVEHQQDLFDQWTTLKADFAGLNGHLVWPEPPEDDVVEVVWVEANPISHLVFTTDGRRYARLAGGLLSFAEFKATFGRSVTAHINGLAYDRVRRMQRALELLQIEAPYEVRVQMASDSGVQEKTMHVYDMAQPVEYATRHHMVCCAIDGEAPT